MTLEINKNITILGIESSCDETSVAVLREGKILANRISTQLIHSTLGGVVPELASRAHQQMIVPVTLEALNMAGISASDIDLIAFTTGPGLMGSLLVGSSFAKGLSLALGKPLIAVNHMQAHILAHLISDPRIETKPPFPFLCLTVSGGHTQLVKVNSVSNFELLGQTLDDAAGEAFDKSAKILGLPYPGGPEIDRLASIGNPSAFSFSKPRIEGLDFSFSGLKTSILYFLKAAQKDNPDFIEHNKADLCASIQSTIVEILCDKVRQALHSTGLNNIALSGGVSANSGLRLAMKEMAQELNVNLFTLPLEFCTDNAAMIATAGYYLYSDSGASQLADVPQARLSVAP